MKTSLCILGIISLQLIATVGQGGDSTDVVGFGASVRTTESSAAPNAVVVSMQGKCAYSKDGVDYTDLSSKQVYSFKKAKPGRNAAGGVKPIFVFEQGAVIRTGADSRIDLFFRRTGITVRLQPNTAIKLERMSRSLKDGVPVVETLLDLRAGRIFTVVRSVVPGSTLEIRNAAGRSVVTGGGGNGRYIITADGTQVADKNSKVPLKFIGNTGVTVIAPGMKFDAREGKLLPVETPEAVKWLIEFDELDALSEEGAQSDEATGNQ